MTEKRFVFDPSINHFQDTLTDQEYSEYNLDDVVDMLNEINDENEQLKKEVEMLRNGLKAYDEALPLYLDCEDIMHFNSRELFEFQMEQMDFYKKHPNRIHYK